jgi:predicted permease
MPLTLLTVYILECLGSFHVGFYLPSFSFSQKKHFPKHQIITIGFYGLVLFYGLSTIIVGTFPCDHGCNPEFTNPSTAQIIHNLFGFLTYLTVPCCILLLGVGLRKTNHSRLSNHGIFLGSLSSLFVLYLFLNPLTHFIGMYQRIIESIFLLWIISCATTLKKMNHDD